LAGSAAQAAEPADMNASTNALAPHASLGCRFMNSPPIFDQHNADMPILIQVRIMST
jgi:hypothetical protein